MNKIVTGRVTGRKFGKNKDGSKNTLNLQVEITSPDDVQTVQLMSQTGEHNNPPNDSDVVILSIGEAFKIAIASDDAIEFDILPGEKVIYSTSEDGKTLKAYAHLKNNGDIHVINEKVEIIAENGGNISITNDNVSITAENGGDIYVDNTKVFLTMGINGKMDINAIGQMEIAVNKLVVNNDMDVNGTIKCDNLFVNNKAYFTHKHSGVTKGNKNTGGVV